MAIFKKKPQIDRDTAMGCIPVKNELVTETPLESGDLILAYPSMYKPFFSKIQRMFNKNPQKTFTRKIQLDKLGVDVWQLIDNQKTVRRIISEFAQLHLLNHKEAEISVSLFLKSLGEKGLIIIKHKYDQSAS